MGERGRGIPQGLEGASQEPSAVQKRVWEPV